MRSFALAALSAECLIFAAQDLFAASEEASHEDAVAPQTVPIETVRVLGSVPETILETESSNRISAETIARGDPRSAADTLRRAPGAIVGTNSRGETLFTLRNAGERQVGIFLDGAPLQVPWDHRVDLSLIPGLAIGEVTVTRGPLSNLYGPNVSGGAIFLNTPMPTRTHAQGHVEGGEAGLNRLEAGLAWTDEDTRLFVGAEQFGVDGQPLADSVALPFSQSGDLRTNSDQLRRSGLFSASHRLGNAIVGLTALYGQSRSGVPPEGHLDPEVANPRFWRTPDTELAMVIGRVGGEFGSSFDIATTAWAQAFDQSIESYGDASYQRLAATQRDTNRSGGVRLRLGHRLGPHGISVAASSEYAEHDEAIDTAPEERFSSIRSSGGLDYSYAHGAWRGRIGVGLDGLDPRRTGGRSPSDSFLAWNASGGIARDVGRGVTLRFALGSRARLPTMRELFGVALGRFVPNPDLEPERNYTAEFELAWQGSRTTLQAIGFSRWTQRTIGQEITRDDPTALRRVNLNASRVLGAELVGRADIRDWVLVNGHLLASTITARDADGSSTELAERPELQGFGELVLGRSLGPELTFESFLRARAYSMAADGTIRLPDSVSFNARLAYRFVLEECLFSVFIRLDNLFNTEVVPQLGLPASGRWLRAGLNIEL